MFDWLIKKQPKTKTKEVQIGGGNLTVDLPFHLAIEDEEDGTTLVCDPNFDGAVLRFSVLYFSTQDDPNAKKLALDALGKSATKHQKKIRKLNDKHFYSYKELSKSSDEPSEMHYRITGFENALIVASCWIKIETQIANPAKFLLNTIESAMTSLRLSKIQQHKVGQEEFNQEILPLSIDDSSSLENWRQIAQTFARSRPQGYRFLGTDGDLITLQTLLNDETLDKTDTQLLESLGVILGDRLAKKLDLHWVTVRDRWGGTVALQYQDASILLFAKDMLTKRINRGDEVNVLELFNNLVEHVRKMIASGEYSMASPNTSKE